MALGVHTGRLGITSFFDNGDTSEGDDFGNQMEVNRNTDQGLATIVGGEGQYSGTPFASGTQVPAGSWIIVDDSGYPHYRKTVAATDITFGAASGSSDLYAIITIDGAASPDLVDEALTGIEFETVAAGGGAPADHALKLGTGDVTASSFDNFTFIAGIIHAPMTDLDGDGLQYETDGQLAVDVSDFAGTGLEDDGSENLRIAAAAAGDGLQGGAGSALAVDVSDFAGAGLEDDGSENLRVSTTAITTAQANLTILRLAETATPSADANYGKVYTKSDNNLYFQDGAGVEHSVSLSTSFIGEMYQYEAGTVVSINAASAYHLLRGFSEGTTEGFTFNAGSTGSILSFADYSGTVPGTIKATTSASHNLATGDEVSITGTTGGRAYDGVYTITVVDADEFYFTNASWVDTQTAEWDEGSWLEAGADAVGTYLCTWNVSGTSAVASKVYKFELFKNSSEVNTVSGAMTPGATTIQNCSGSGILAVVAGDRIYLAIENQTDTTNFTIQYANVSLHRI